MRIRNGLCSSYSFRYLGGGIHETYDIDYAVHHDDILAFALLLI